MSGYCYNLESITNTIDEMGQALQKRDETLAKIAKIVSERAMFEPLSYTDLPECLELLLDKAGFSKREV